MKQFRTFTEFASEETIIKLLSRERAKFAVKNSRDGECSDTIYLEELKPMMPPRRIWVNPPQAMRPKKGTRGLSAWTYPRKIADARIWGTIRKYKSLTPSAEWVQNLEAFVSRIRRIVEGTAEFTMESPRVLPMFKKEENGEFIYRPICMYTSLETKIILVLTYKYLLEVLDDCFHGNMLFMRSARKDAKGRKVTLNFMDAIRRIESYRKRHDDKQMIFVGECDIQKFYDILNHDDILKCFDTLFSLRVKNIGVDTSVFDPVRRIISAYLDSYDYWTDVMGLNKQPAFWKSEKSKHRCESCPDPVCKFQWVSEKDFISSGCYDDVSFERAKAEGKLGIPQGGALSGIIVNVVMQCIDDDIVREKDPERLFIRYCDDIILMHTDKTKCEEYLATYHHNLREHKLVAHEPVNVRDCKGGSRNHKKFWKEKSKNVYKWGSGGGDASDWVAFVGYEMRRTGEVRIRKDKIDAMFVRVAHRYYEVIHARDMIGGRVITPESKLERFNGISSKILDYEMMTVDRYSIAQAKHIDKYLKRKVAQAARKLNTDVPDNLMTFCRTITDNG